MADTCWFSLAWIVCDIQEVGHVTFWLEVEKHSMIQRSCVFIRAEMLCCWNDVLKSAVHMHLRPRLKQNSICPFNSLHVQRGHLRSSLSSKWGCWYKINCVYQHMSRWSNTTTKSASFIDDRVDAMLSRIQVNPKARPPTVTLTCMKGTASTPLD